MPRRRSSWCDGCARPAAPAKIGGHLRDLTTARPGITLAEIQAALTGASTNMVRRYGWGPRGERLVDAAPHGHWRTTTFVAGLRSTGFVAALVLDGPMTGEAFRAYVEQFLAPALAPGDVVVMDNLAAHKVAGVREAIRAAKASLMHLPAYSPDLHPIELAFATLKAGLRRAGTRTRDALCSTIGCLLDTFTEPECRITSPSQDMRSSRQKIP